VRDWAYNLLRLGLQTSIWGGEILGLQNLPARGPGVLVANHLDALGPIAVAAAVPRRLYPWGVAAMLDPREAPECLRIDFVEKTLNLRLPVSGWLSAALSRLSVPLLTSIGSVPVYPDPESSPRTFALSVEHLLEHRFLLVFPEDPALPVNPRYKMTPFKKGFARIGEHYFERTQEILRFYPVAVHGERRVVQVAQSIAYNPHNRAAAERLRLKNVLESMIHEMYLALGSAAYVGVTLPQ